MNKKIVKIRNLHDSSTKDDLHYWLSKPPEERVAAVDYLRKLHHGNTGKILRVARVVQRKQKNLPGND